MIVCMLTYCCVCAIVADLCRSLYFVCTVKFLLCSRILIIAVLVHLFICLEMFVIITASTTASMHDIYNYLELVIIIKG